MFAKYVEEQDAKLFIFVASLVCNGPHGIKWNEHTCHSTAEKAEKFLNTRCEDFSADISKWSTTLNGDASYLHDNYTYRAYIRKHEVL